MKEEKCRADLHYHGPIGFEPYWIRVQDYKGKNLLKLIADAGFKSKLNILAVTSETDQTDKNGIIIRNSIHNRIGYLAENYLNDLNKIQGYKADKFGASSIMIEKNGNKLYLISGQTPIIKEGDKRYDHLIVGSDSVPNFRNFQDTLKYCNDNGVLHGEEHPDLEVHFGLGLNNAEKYIELSDFVEGHNAQLLWPGFMRKIPKIGDYTELNNNRAKEFAEKHNKPWIATSDGHMIESAGAAYIEFDASLLDERNEDNLLKALRTIVKESHFKPHEGYDSLINWLEWTIKFQWGIRGERYKRN